jgi:hypothetical protein
VRAGITARMPPQRIVSALAAVGAGTGIYLGVRAWRSAPSRFAHMSGSSIVAPDAAAWVTDFLNAAYFRRRPELRDPDDLRLAFAILTTRWHRLGHRRLRAPDALVFHRAFARDRFLDTSRSPRGTLSREQLLEGAAALHGDWFGAAYADDERRAWGIAFETLEERAAYRPEERLRAATLGALTPESAPPTEQTWHTYPPVAVSSAEAVVAALTRPETWPDLATEIGRFTPVRTGGLQGQTFEIEVAAGTAAGRPLFTRGYVTITTLVTSADEAALRAYVDELNDGLARFGRDEPPSVPEGATPIVGFDLTTHEGHFMGAGHNRLVLYEEDGQAYVRAAGTWDPMPWHLEQAYRRAGRDAQHAFWGQGAIEEQSMLHQLARRTAAATPA